jgi:hypothetical protein
LIILKKRDEAKLKFVLRNPEEKIWYRKKILVYLPNEILYAKGKAAGEYPLFDPAGLQPFP